MFLCSSCFLFQKLYDILVNESNEMCACKNEHVRDLNLKSFHNSYKDNFFQIHQCFLDICRYIVINALYIYIYWTLIFFWIKILIKKGGKYMSENFHYKFFSFKFKTLITYLYILVCEYKRWIPVAFLLHLTDQFLVR